MQAHAATTTKQRAKPPQPAKRTVLSTIFEKFFLLKNHLYTEQLSY